MNIRLDPNYKAQIQNNDQPVDQVVNRQGDALDSGKESTQRHPHTDTIELTQNANELRRLEQSVLDLPDVNQEKVAQIKQAIDDGSFQINIESTIEKMITLETDPGLLKG